MLILGYPAQEPRYKPMRPLKEMIHFDRCGETDFRTDEEVRAYFGK
jgi:hypothetical protein